MTDIDAVIGRTGSKEAVVAVEAAKEHISVEKSLTFERFLVITTLFTAVLGAYESLTESLMPAWSILAQAHRLGYMKSYPVAYEPGKGIWHPMGWIGSGMMVVMMLYSLRKRVGLLSGLGSMRHWLSAHMFLGIMGPLLVTFHTTFKFHGLVATSFWCMIVTMLFGILGRYIYIQIPRNITGAELGVRDIEKIVGHLDKQLGRHLRNSNITRLLSELGVTDIERIVKNADREAPKYVVDTHISNLLNEIGPSGDNKGRNAASALFYMMAADIKNHFRIRDLRKELKARYRLSRYTREEIVALLKKKAAFLRRKDLLSTSHRLLHYWHVFHVPLAIVMFIIMFLHIIIYYMFRPGV